MKTPKYTMLERAISHGESVSAGRFSCPRTLGEKTSAAGIEPNLSEVVAAFSQAWGEVSALR